MAYLNVFAPLLPLEKLLRIRQLPVLMAKSANLHVHPHSRSAEVPPHVLESLVTNTYDKSLSEQEARVLAAVPPYLQNWFTSIVIEGFYIKARHVFRQAAKQTPQPTGPDLALLEILVAELLPRGEVNGFHADKRKTLRESYAARQNLSITGKTYISRRQSFEDAAVDKIGQYSKDLTKSLKVHYQNGLPFSYKPASEIIETLRAKMLG